MRVEDPKFLRGQGCYVADITLPGELHCVLVRSPHAHARIRQIDSSKAAASPGVAAVFTGADMAADKVGPMAPLWAIATSDGKPMAEPPRWALARGTVRHVGEAVAAVIAETRAQAEHAADLLLIDYEPLPVVVDGRAAMDKGAPQLHEAAPGNVCFRFARGDEAAVRKAFDRAAHVVRLDLANNRLIGAAIEPRAVLADGGVGKLTLYSSTQVPHHIRRTVTEQLGLPQTAIRLIAPDVGGGFGYKGKHYPEETIIAWAARRLRRPVKWVATRSECFVSDYQGRGHQTRAELASMQGAFPRASRRHRGQHRRLCLDLRRRHPERDLQPRSWRACTAPRPSRCNRPACSPIRCRPMPIAALAAPRPAMCWSASPMRRRASRDRPRRDLPAQPRTGRGDALEDSDRAYLRLRKSRCADGPRRTRRPAGRDASRRDGCRSCGHFPSTSASWSGMPSSWHPAILGMKPAARARARATGGVISPAAGREITILGGYIS